jgi:transcriptional regulator GlxA family with amidase domain
MKLGIPVYKGVNLLDIAGPLEMFYWTGAPKKYAGEGKDLTTVLISADGKPVRALNGVCFEAQASFAETPTLDILWVPGGNPEALSTLMQTPDTPYLKYLRQVASGAKWVCSVCEGALLLARAGLLDGHKVTTHWAFINCLKDRQKFPGIDPDDVDTAFRRFVVSEKKSGNRLTGGGISSGLDEALQLIVLLYGEETAKNVQSTTQYFPQPPVMGELPWTPPACPVTWIPNNK